MLGTLRQRFISDTSGATAIEYALIAALLSLTILVGVTFLGSGLTDLFLDLGSNNTLIEQTNKL